MQSFNNQQDLPNALPKKFIALHPIDASQLETTYLPEVVAKLGKRSLLALLNEQLVNPCFDVKFGFKHVKRTLMAGEYTDIALFYSQTGFTKTEASTFNDSSNRKNVRC